MRNRISVMFTFLLILAGIVSAQSFPKPTGYVSDFAGIIDGPSRQRLQAVIAEVKRKTGAEIAVATFKTIGGSHHDDYANRLFEAWGIGQKGKDNGLLFFVALKERKLRIETGYGLEGALPDLVCARIRDTYLVPSFRQGRYGQGLVLGVSAAAELIAKETGATLTGTVRAPAPQRRQRTRRTSGGGPGSLILKILFGIFFLYMLIRHPRLLFLMLLTSGGGRRGGWSGGGGGFGGGFGGFGGGMSGGGGAGGSW